MLRISRSNFPAVRLVRLLGGSSYGFGFKRRYYHIFGVELFEIDTDTETDVHFDRLLVADARTLNSHLQDVQAPILKYTSELTIDLAEWNVEPSQVSVVVDNPLFLWLRLLPVPAPRSPLESYAAYLARLGPCPVDVRWDYTPLTNEVGSKVIDGCASGGELWRAAMESTPPGSYPAMINISLDGVSLNTHAAEKSCCPVKVVF